MGETVAPALPETLQQILEFLKNLFTTSYSAMLTLPSEVKTIMLIAIAISIAGGLAKGVMKLAQAGIVAFIVYALLASKKRKGQTADPLFCVHVICALHFRIAFCISFEI